MPSENLSPSPSSATDQCNTDANELRDESNNRPSCKKVSENKLIFFFIFSFILFELKSFRQQ